jgi:hypothetical protein
MALRDKPRGKLIFEGKARMIGGEGDFHLPLPLTRYRRFCHHPSGAFRRTPTATCTFSLLLRSGILRIFKA